MATLTPPNIIRTAYAENIVTDLDQNAYASTVDLGKQQRAEPVFTYEFFRPNHSATDCSINAAILAERHGGCPASDPAIRKAIAQATDKAAILHRILGDAGQIANSSVTPMRARSSEAVFALAKASRLPNWA